MNTLGARTSHRQLWTHKTHHSPDSGEATTFPHIVFSALLHCTHARMAFCLGTPKVESRNCPGFGHPRLCNVIILCSNLRLGWGLKQTCSSPWELSNGVSHSICTHWGQVDSRLLTCVAKAIFDIFTSIYFPMIWRTLQGEVFWPLQSSYEVFGILRDSQVPILGSVNVILTLFQKWGCNTLCP
jgi:hypothetical protein